MANNLILRTLSSLVLIPLVISTVYFGGIYLLLLAAVCMFLMLREWVMLNKQSVTQYRHNIVLLIGGVIYISIPMIFVMLYAVSDISYTLPATLWKGSQTHNIFNYALWILSVAWSCDIFAYCGGKMLGGAKLAPSISPKKTWSGTITGIIVTLLLTHNITANFLPYKPLYVDIMTFFMCVAAIFGDLIESKAKRMLGVKDSGNIIPGHGGICDRLDSLLLVLYLFIAYDMIQYIRSMRLF